MFTTNVSADPLPRLGWQRIRWICPDASQAAATNRPSSSCLMTNGAHLCTTLRRIRSGERVTAQQLEALGQEQRRLRQVIGRSFEDIDVIVTPTTPIPAPRIDELKENPDLLRPRELILLRNTRPLNAWGLPAISVPCGFTENGLPIGLQIAGPHWAEARVLQVAHRYEQVTAWHKKSPAILSC